MTSEPLVCCIMLTRDRPQMAARAVRAFRAQTYYAKKLVVIDTSPKPIDIEGSHVTILSNPTSTSTIGELRNTGNTYASKGLAEQPDILIHWDDDDYSHPNRIAEQVAMLQSGDYDAVGYREMLFWRTVPQSVKDGYAEVLRRFPPDPNVPMPEHLKLRQDEAYIYTHPHANYCIGTSLCYWRRTWEAKPFPDLPIPGNPQSASEDWAWQSGLRTASVSSLRAWPASDATESVANIRGWTYACDPRMIATIHGQNYGQANYELGLRHGDVFKRVPEWDDYCREILESE